MAARAAAVLARWRSGRPFHPDGALFTADLAVLDGSSAVGRAWGVGSWPTLARFSRSASLTRSGPDVLGAALRVSRTPERDVDVLMVTTLGPGLGDVLLAPARTWTSRRYSTLMPFVVDGSWVLLGLRSTDDELDDATTASLSARVEVGPVTFELIERGLGSWRPVGHLRLLEQRPDTERIRFDPVAHDDPDLGPAPGIRRLRHAAYWGAQHPDRALKDTRAGVVEGDPGYGSGRPSVAREVDHG